jgi:hypothetical protein
LTPIVVGGYGAVLTDQPNTTPQPEVVGAVVTSETTSEFARINDSRFLILSHPAELFILEEAGFTWWDLLCQGRYVSTTNVVCRRCGMTFPRRRLEAPAGIGCNFAIVVGLFAGIIFGLWRQSFVVWLIAWYLTTVAMVFSTQWLATAYVRRFFAQRVRELDSERYCPECHVDDSQPIAQAKSVTCPTCSQKTLFFDVVGDS